MTDMTASSRWIDTHCHIPPGDEGLAQINQSVDAGVARMICVGTDAETSRQSIEIARSAGQIVRATVGLHPHDAKNGMGDLIALFDNTIADPDHPIVAIGECGLDYFYDHSEREIQKEIFIAQIELAKRHDLALVVHTRDAWKETFEILRSQIAPRNTIIHCFTGGPEEAKTCLDMGFYLSFSGIATFKNAVDIRKAAEICPLDRILIETDSPFLTPVPFRGKPNEPAKVVVIGEFLSELKNVQVEQFSEAIFRNSHTAFSLQSL